MTALPHGPAESPPALERLFPARGPLVLGVLGLAVLAGGLLGWGAFASISGAVIAVGRVEVETRDQVVEHIDGGTVGRILVKNGDRVKAGDVLVRLDDGEFRSEETILAAEHAELVARRNRLEAEFRDVEAIVWAAALAVRAQTDPAVRAILDGQRRLFEARRASRAGQKAQLRERVAQTVKQIASLEAQAAAVARQGGYVARELEAQRALFDEGLTQLQPLMALEREAARLDGQAGDIAARIAAARSRIAEIEIQVLQIDAKRIEEAEAEAREAQARENQVRERLASVRARLGRMEVRAPVAGEVFDMRVFAPREVVRPDEPILKIVPEDTALVVRARLEPIHVDQVWSGQAAVLLFTAFPARTTPAFEGTVLRVAADASRDERTGLEWYEVEVAMGPAVEADPETGPAAWARAARETAAGWFAGIAGHESPPERLREALSGTDGGTGGTERSRQAPAHARDLALAPGMPAEVHIRTGERSPLSYLAKPLTDYFSRSLREE